MTPLESSHRNKGFTLIEILIYAAITTVIITFSILAVYQFLDASDRLKNQRELIENQHLLEQKISWALQSVSAINSPTLGATSTILSVDKIGFSENPVVIDIDGGAARLKRGSAPALQITNDAYSEIQNLAFRQFDFSGHPAIRISADLYNAFTSTTVNIDRTIIIR
jgi:type II secretory pathway pseudopilin PulG